MVQLKDASHLQSINPFTTLYVVYLQKKSPIIKFPVYHEMKDWVIIPSTLFPKLHGVVARDLISSDN